MDGKSPSKYSIVLVAGASFLCLLWVVIGPEKVHLPAAASAATNASASPAAQLVSDSAQTRDGTATSAAAAVPSADPAAAGSSSLPAAAADGGKELMTAGGGAVPAAAGGGVQSAAAGGAKRSIMAAGAGAVAGGGGGEELAPLDFTRHHTGVETGQPLVPQAKVYAPCSRKLIDTTPCEDAARGRGFPREHMAYKERHCPGPGEGLGCLVPPPVGYKYPLPWPQSRDAAWYVNVPHKHLTVEKAVQNWVQYDEATEKFLFPGGGTMFANGAGAYLDELKALIPLEGGAIRTAVDTGCGVASFGGYLLSRGVLTMSFAPRDNHEAQVQFALERGIPAMLGILGSMRLPYPARAFDLAHCSRCLIPWANDGGLYLAEIDRILRPGGFWVLTGPPINWKVYARGWQRTPEDLKAEQDRVEAAAAGLCWKKHVERGMFAIWQKPLTSDCVAAKPAGAVPPRCSPEQDPDAAWYTKMEACVSRVPEGGDQELAKWPLRADAVPPRIASSAAAAAVTPEEYAQDKELWAKRVRFYKERLLPPLGTGQYRNILDLNAHLGSFAAALKDDPVWVMNTVPPPAAGGGGAAPDTLGIIYERGFIGTYQDWCEPFSTYPRTYDLIHGAGAFSLLSKRCPLDGVLLELDRILRPEAAAIFRDDVDVIARATQILKGMRWDCRIADHEDGPFNKEKLLVCVKKYWTN